MHAVIKISSGMGFGTHSWMDGWMDGWIDGLMDGWMDE
jgi:hypothetical protein